jgi:hypothetical protein
LSDNDGGTVTVRWSHEFNLPQVPDMQNMKYVAMFAAIALCAGIVALAMAASPIVALSGKLAIAVSVVGFAAIATTYVMDQSVAALSLRNEDFHWY